MSRTKKLPPREVPTWDQYFLQQAVTASKRSKDPHTQHGAVVVSPANLSLGIGYNGGARRIPDDAFSWSRPAKYAWIYHAEENALWMARRTGDLDGCTIYITGHPCPSCMLRIVHAGIIRVVHLDVASASVGRRQKNLVHRMAKLSGTTIDYYSRSEAGLDLTLCIKE